MIKFVYRQAKKYIPYSYQSSIQRLTTPISVEESGATPACRPRGNCTLCAAEKRANYTKSWGLLLGLLPAYFVASLEVTIVATALPEIASHYNRFGQLNWPATAFNLTSTAFIPVFGQLADTFGRYASLQFAAVMSLIGSIICATAPSWPALLLGRAFQGIGAAGIDNVTMIILADQASLKEHAVNVSIFQLLNGIGYSIGPVVGGYLTKANWRYCFVLCAVIVFLGLFAIFLIRGQLKPGKLSVYHPPSGQTPTAAIIEGLSTLDYGGIFMFVTGVCLLIMGTTWGGATFPWDSAAVISSLVVGGILILLFCLYEYLLEPGRLLSRWFPRTIPMIPAALLHKKDILIICFVAVGAGATFYSIFYFVGIFFTLVKAYTASEAGTKLLYYIPGLGIGVYAAIRCCNHWPRQTFWALCLGTIFQTVGIAVLAAAVKFRDEKLVAITMALTGAGTGAVFMPSNLHVAGMFNDHLASAYSLMRFSLPFGGTIALAMMDSVFQNEIAGNSTGTSGANGYGSPTSQGLDSINVISSLPNDQQDTIRRQASTAIMFAFISIVPITALATILVMFLGNVWITTETSSQNAIVQQTGGTNEIACCEEHAGSNVDSSIAMPDAIEMRHAHCTESDSSPAETSRYTDSVYLLGLIRQQVKDGTRRV